VVNGRPWIARVDLDGEDHSILWMKTRRVALGLLIGKFSLSVHFVTILNPMYLLSCSVHFLVELKACK
jgi:hypothetical protein